MEFCTDDWFFWIYFYSFAWTLIRCTHTHTTNKCITLTLWGKGGEQLETGSNKFGLQCFWVVHAAVIAFKPSFTDVTHLLWKFKNYPSPTMWPFWKKMCASANVKPTTPDLYFVPFCFSLPISVSFWICVDKWVQLFGIVKKYECVIFRQILPSTSKMFIHVVAFFCVTKV